MGRGRIALAAVPELAVVKLSEPVGGWAVETAGTLLVAYADGGIVEVDDDEGRTLDLIAVRYDQIEAMTTDSELVG